MSGKDDTNAKAPPEPIPELPSDLSAGERRMCTALVYCAIKLTLEAKKNFTSEQRVELASAVDAVLGERRCQVFPLAVATWLRNKQELGNRLVSTCLLAQCAHREPLRPFMRRTCKLVLKLPTDLMELLTEFECIDPSAKRPCCIKKAAKDMIEGIGAFQCLKYDNREKIKRTKLQLRNAEKALGPKDDKDSVGDAKGPGYSAKAFGKGAGKGAKAENKQRDADKNVTELKTKLGKLVKGDLGGLIRYCHASQDSDKIMRVLRKRYPETAEEFEASGLVGEFDEARAQERMRLLEPDGVQTFDRELSANGNVPKTWAKLLTTKKERGFYTLPYMALLRNLRNILLMGLRPEFLREHVLRRLTDRRQIQGSGQTAVSISHTWATLEKEFDAESIKEMQEKSRQGVRDIMAYKSILKKIRGPILGTSDKHIGIIGEFLGCPVWEPCSLRRQNECFLIMNTVQLRGGQVLAAKGKGRRKGGAGPLAGKGKSAGGTETEKWLPVAVHPVSTAFMAELKETFDRAIETAASCNVLAMPFKDHPDGPVVLWMDYSNPPLDSIEGSTKVAAVANKETEPKGPEGTPWMSGVAYDPNLLTTQPGQQIDINEITTHRNLTLELRYFAPSYIDYNIQAFDHAGSSLWNSTYSTPEVKSSKGINCCVHCRDIAGNPNATTPALRTLHVDLDSIDDNVKCFFITSQNFSGSTGIKSVSLAVRECHNGGAGSLRGNHEWHDCKGNLLFVQDISEPLKNGGTTIYACLTRDVNDPETWIFRNTLDLSLSSETRVASQMSACCSDIFKQLFQTKANMSTMDANRVGSVRLCQLYEAVTGVGCSRNVKLVCTGVKKKQPNASAEELKLSSKYMENLEAVAALKNSFTGKAVDVDEALGLVLAQCGDAPPVAILRVANNSLVPSKCLADLRAKAGRCLPYAAIDGRGHIFDALDDLPQEGAVFLPGQVESCVTILRNLVEKPGAQVGGFEALVRYVDTFLPRDADLDGVDDPVATVDN